jgi:hypothetical protein
MVRNPKNANKPENPHRNVFSLVCKDCLAPMYAPSNAPVAKKGATRKEQFPAM